MRFLPNDARRIRPLEVATNSTIAKEEEDEEGVTRTKQKITYGRVRPSARRAFLSSLGREEGREGGREGGRTKGRKEGSATNANVAVVRRPSLNRCRNDSSNSAFCSITNTASPAKPLKGGSRPSRRIDGQTDRWESSAFHCTALGIPLIPLIQG